MSAAAPVVDALDATTPTRTREGDDGGTSDPLARSWLAGAAEGRLYFAQVREDPRLEIEVLRPSAEGTYVVISSGGCTALSLLAAGAGRVAAVDRNTTQNHLLELKAAATALGSGRAIAFLGGSEQDAAARLATYGILRGGLTPAARVFWDARSRTLGRGVLGSGATERFIALVVAGVRLAVHGDARIRRLFACRTLEEQRRLFAAEWDTWRWRALFEVLLNRWCFHRALEPEFFRHVDTPSFARHFRSLTAHALTGLPVAENYFLRHMLTGRYGTATPPYLTVEGARRVAARRRALRLVDGSLTAYLRTCPDGSIDGFALSNICEWLPPTETEDLLREVVRTAAPGAALCLRNFMGWTQVPEGLRERIVEDRARGEALAKTDRAFVNRRFAPCRVVPRARAAGATRAAAREGCPRVRPATPDDDAALRSLAASCVMEGEIGLRVDREPEFFALNRLEGEAWQVGVAEGADGRIVGCVAFAERRAYLAGRPTRMLYASDLKVRPEHRGRGVADALVVFVLEAARARSLGDAPILLAVLEGNRPMERLAGGVRGLPATVRCGTVRSHAWPILWRRVPRASAHVRVTPATENDLDEMARLWPMVASRRQFAPAHDAGSLSRWIASAPGLGLSSYRLARRPDGRLAGFVGLWDQRAFKQLRVTRHSWRTRTVRAAYNGLTSIVGAAPLPAAGEELRCLTAVNLCVPAEEPGTLAALLGDAVRANGVGGHCLLNVGLDARDPLARALDGVFTIRTSIGLYVTSPGGSYAGPSLDERPIHFETALV